jgi:chromosome segregation ATPase
MSPKLSSLESRLSRVEEELKSAKASEKDMQHYQRKILEDNKELTKQNEQLDSEVGELREELDAQKQTLVSIHTMLETLKESSVGGDVAKTVVKAEKAVRDNAWNVSCKKNILIAKHSHEILEWFSKDFP